MTGIETRMKLSGFSAAKDKRKDFFFVLTQFYVIKVCMKQMLPILPPSTWLEEFSAVVDFVVVVMTSQSIEVWLLLN